MLTFRPTALLLWLSCVIVAVSGCAARNGKPWSTRDYLKATPVSAGQAVDLNLDTAEQTYRRAIACEKSGSAVCVDLYALAAEQAWPAIATVAEHGAAKSTEQQTEVYRSALAKLISTSQSFGKFNPSRGIEFTDGRTLPIATSEIAWHPTEIGRLELVGDYKLPNNIRRHQKSGIGAPLLVHTKTERKYISKGSVSVATAILCPQPVLAADTTQVSFHLEIVNTLRVQETSVDGHVVPLAVDTTAPLGFLEANATRLGMSGLFKPGQAHNHGGLQMIEPYQRGKIPVVFIHGLASDPLTWGSMANDVFINKDILDRFQFWTFSYPTGDPFPREAARLRRQLVRLREHIDPNHVDAALDNMVLIGHSMGGLLAKMQITTSRDELIRSISKVPLEQLNLKQETREKFADWFQFTPSKSIKRVVFIGTPHQGSGRANGIATQLASRLIRQPDELEDIFDELIENNERVLTTNLKRIPNSIDLLRPDNSLRQAIFKLPVNHDVSLHSIIGVGHGGTWGRERSDGVVPYHSAQHPSVESEVTVDASHSLHNHPNSTSEVVRVLRLHAANAPSYSADPIAAHYDSFSPTSPR